MKVFMVILCLVSTVFADGDGGQIDPRINHDGHDYSIRTYDDLLRYSKECGEKMKLSADEMKKYRTWNYENTATSRCFMKCLLEKFGIFDETHGFHAYMIHHQLVGTHGEVDHNDELFHQIDLCADRNGQGSDPCTWAYRGALCLRSYNLPLVKEHDHEL